MDTTAKVIPDDLKKIEFCADMTDGDRAILANMLIREEFGFDQVVFRSGSPADACYLVEDGLVALEVCSAGVGCRRMMTVGPGELIGWSPFIGDSCFTATARTLETTRLLKLPADKIRDACNRNHAFGFHILRRVVKVLAARINSSRIQMLDLFGPENPTIPEYPSES